MSNEGTARAFFEACAKGHETKRLDIRPDVMGRRLGRAKVDAPMQAARAAGMPRIQARQAFRGSDPERSANAGVPPRFRKLKGGPA